MIQNFKYCDLLANSERAHDTVMKINSEFISHLAILGMVYAIQIPKRKHGVKNASQASIYQTVWSQYACVTYIHKTLEIAP